jgi:uncharacterized protein (DUF2141 family)
MKIHHQIQLHVIATLLVVATIESFAQAPTSFQVNNNETAQLEVKITGIRNDTGMLGCQVFSASTGFPNDSDKARAGIYVPIKSGTAACLFTALPTGTYAVAVLHDENNNKVLDTNTFGIPKEGYGVSNNKTYAMSQPKWDESRFNIATGEKKQIAIQLRY